MQKKVVFKFAELFCGPGGLSLGAKNANVAYKDMAFSVKPVWANDYDESTCKTYARNIHAGNSENVICSPVEKVDFAKVPDFDALAFGFPCNDFSVVGKQKGFNGKFGPLYTYALKAIKEKNPKWFMAENVSGLQSANNGMAFRKILEDLENAGEGYELTANLYKFEEYSVPQTRHRIVIIGIRKDLNLKFKVPAPTTKMKYITAQQAIEEPRITSNSDNNEITAQSSNVVERLKYFQREKMHGTMVFQII